MDAVHGSGGDWKAEKLRSDPLEDHDSRLHAAAAESFYFCSPMRHCASAELQAEHKELIAILQDSLESLDHASEYDVAC